MLYCSYQQDLIVSITLRDFGRFGGEVDNGIQIQLVVLKFFGYSAKT
jgi:hypothetical protein